MARMTFLGIHPPVVIAVVENALVGAPSFIQLAAKPLDARLRQVGTEVLISYPPWPSLHGRWFTISRIVSLAAAQIELAGSNTTGEPNFVGTGTLAIRETRTVVPPG